MEVQAFEKLGIRNLHSVFGRGVRGETLARESHMGQKLEFVRDAGVKVVVDFRTADHSDRFARRCTDVGIVYHHIPIDSQIMPSEELFKTLPLLFEVIDGNDFYISCQQGFHRTDIALALYYFCRSCTGGHCKDVQRRPGFPE